MKKAIYIAVLGGFGDVTHSTQIARRFARDLNMEVIFIAAHSSKGEDVPCYDVTPSYADHRKNTLGIGNRRNGISRGRIIIGN